MLTKPSGVPSLGPAATRSFRFWFSPFSRRFSGFFPLSSCLLFIVRSIRPGVAVGTYVIIPVSSFPLVWLLLITRPARLLRFHLQLQVYFTTTPISSYQHYRQRYKSQSAFHCIQQRSVPYDGRILSILPLILLPVASCAPFFGPQLRAAPSPGLSHRVPFARRRTPQPPTYELIPFSLRVCGRWLLQMKL